MEAMGQIYHRYFQKITAYFTQAETSYKNTTVSFELTIPQRSRDGELTLGSEASQEHLLPQTDTPIALSVSYMLLPAGCSPASAASQRSKSSKCRDTKHPPTCLCPVFLQSGSARRSNSGGENSLKGLQVFLGLLTTLLWCTKGFCLRVWIINWTPGHINVTGRYLLLCSERLGWLSSSLQNDICLKITNLKEYILECCLHGCVGGKEEEILLTFY